MFTTLPGRNSLGVAADRIVAVIESMNAPNISVPELGTEPAKAWLIGCFTPGGGACVFCYLLLLDTNRPICYISNPPEVPLDRYSTLEAESIQFVESMGFILDNMNLRSRPPADQAALLAALPFLREQLPRTASRPQPLPGLGGSVGSSVEPASERLALVRLLASF